MSELPKLVCKIAGHNWEMTNRGYAVSYNFEGKCLRCKGVWNAVEGKIEYEV